jgi:aminotransferase
MLARRVQSFSESVIREMTRLAEEHDALSLGQGLPDFEPPPEVLDAACQAIRAGFNQYSFTWGAPVLRQAVAARARATGLEWCEADAHVTICCGATECMMAAMLALVDPGDEVVLFQPFYENYVPDARLAGATPVFVDLHPPDWRFAPDELRRAFSPRTRAIVVNTPNNPTGRVFTLGELTQIAQLCQEHDAIALTDEIYEHILHVERPHLRLAALPGMAERTVTISGLSKTFCVTGWRLGYCIAPEGLTAGIRKAHDFLTVAAPHPLQLAGAVALALPESYYHRLQADYRRRRDLFTPYLRQAGLSFTDPEGAYYILADFAGLWPGDDVAFVRRLITEVGVAAVPGSSFYSPPQRGRTLVRFMFAKRDETLHEAGRRLQRLRHLAGSP